MAAPTRSACAPGTKECSRHAMSAPMTTMETKGAPRRREDAEKAPRPRRSTTGQATARGRGRTSRTSPPIRALLPAARRARAPRRRHTPRRVRTLTGVAPGKVRRRARPPRVEKSACSRATLAHDRGTSPVRPTTPGARTSPTSGPSTHARWRSARRADRARQPESLMHQRSRGRLAPSSGAHAPVDNPRRPRHPVDNPRCSRHPVDNPALARVSMDTSCARAPSSPSARAPKCKNGPHG